jgi:hypothetical protein
VIGIIGCATMDRETDIRREVLVDSAGQLSFEGRALTVEQLIGEVGPPDEHVMFEVKLIEVTDASFNTSQALLKGLMAAGHLAHGVIDATRRSAIGSEQSGKAPQ